MFTVIKLILVLVLFFFIICLARTWQLEFAPEQKIFITGTLPSPRPDGFYRGTVPGHTTEWQGKKFNATDSTGINVFKNTSNSASTVEKYPFKTSVTKGSHDRDTQVLAIDYNISANPFWLRPVLDEIVQTSPGNYLGKLQLRVIPGYPFTLVYFKLAK